MQKRKKFWISFKFRQPTPLAPTWRIQVLIKRSIANFEGIVRRITHKLARRKARTLSAPGKVALIKSNLTGISSIYYEQVSNS